VRKAAAIEVPAIGVCGCAHAASADAFSAWPEAGLLLAALLAAGWALALPPTATATGSVAVKAVDLATGAVTPLITGITSDAELSGEVVAPSGNTALLTIDSFTELAVHYLRLDEPGDVAVDLITPGPSVIAPDGSGFAVSENDMTAVYDESGAEGARFPGNVLAWV